MMNLKDWCVAFKNGEFEDKNVRTQINAGWYDWFCRDSALALKTAKLGRKACLIALSPKVDAEKSYVFFKNNCPVVGNLYDDFRICDIETGDVLWTIVPSDGHKVSKGKASVWGKENNFDGAIVEGTWDDVLEYFFS